MWTLLFLFSFASARLIHHSIVRGAYTTVLTYDPDYPEPLDYMYTAYNATHIHIVGVYSATAYTVLCRETVTTPIIVAPKGCDTDSPDTAVLRTNCGHKTILGLLSTWMYDPSDDVCIRAGSEATCFGHPLLVSTGLEDDGDDLNVMQGVIVISGVGPRCSIPAVTRMDVVMPALVVSSTCEDIPEGRYETDTQAEQQQRFEFWRFGVTLILTRDETLTVTSFGDLVYTHYNASFGVEHTHTNVSCEFTLVLDAAPRPFELNSLDIPRTYDYYKNKIDKYYRTAACGFGVGRRRYEDGRSWIQGVAEGVPYGGIPIFRTLSGIPIQVDADPRFADFEDDCASFYPADTTFNGFGFSGFDGPVYERHVPAQYTCYAPFPYPELILEIGTLDARAKQCHMLGGVLATDTSDVCAKDSWRTYCRRGWLYFDQRCWYKFDYQLESSLQVPAGPDSDRVCSQMHPSAVSSFTFPIWTSAWLQRFFVFWKYPETITRVVIRGRRCECYSGVNGVVSCDCDDPAFPLCSYAIKNDPIYWGEIDYPPETLAILSLGQIGAPPDVHGIRCGCLPGSKGPQCGQRTCVTPIEAATSVNASLRNPAVAFFKACYAHRRGFCQNGDPNLCQCVTGYGPPASLLAGVYTSTPCWFPTWVGTSSAPQNITINGIVSLSVYAVCGFHGLAVSTGWNDGHCECPLRWSLSRVAELAFDGPACSCHVSHYEPGFEVIEATCNGHGTCCPHGVRTDGVDGYCPRGHNGCFCDDGWTGESCTARVPSISALVPPSTLGSGWTAVTQQVRLAVTKVYVSNQATNVTLRDTVDGIVTGTCVSVVSETWEAGFGYKWSCDGTQAWVIRAENPDTVIYPYSQDYPPGGVHVNPYGARFFSIPQFRSYGEYMELQPFKWSQHGVTNTIPTCEPGYTGEICAIGVSGYRLNEGTAHWSPRLCGDSTEPKRGEAVGDECACGAIGDGIVFTGDACSCALVDGEMCGGIGTCVDPVFPYGFCSADQELLSRDALRTPYSGVIPLPRFLVHAMNPYNFSVVTIQNKSWAMFEGQELLLDTVRNDVLLCGAHHPVSVTYVRNESVELPRRVYAYTTYLEVICDTCEEMVRCEYTDAPRADMPCVDGELVIGQVCILSTEWIFGEDAEILEEGEYKESLLPCTNATLIDAVSTGVKDCSNPLDRLLDNIGECHEPIGAYDNTLGLGFGLFYNLTPGVDFSQDSWTRTHYEMLDAVIGGCDTFDEPAWDRYVEYLASFNDTEEFYGDIQGYVREVEVTFPVDVYGVQLVGLNGVCGTYLQIIPANTTVSIACNGDQNVTVMLSRNETLESTTKAIWSPISYEYTPLEQSILNNHVFPTNPETCNRTIDVDDPLDQQFLRRMHSAHFMPRRCSSDGQCAQFNTNSTCVRDAHRREAWLNGDGDPTIGREGGCDCAVDTTGFYSPTRFCGACESGYGPDTSVDISNMHTMRSLISGWVTLPVERCSVPHDSTSTRPSTLCGGRGHVRQSGSITIGVKVTIQEHTVRLCRSLVTRDTEFTLVDEDAVHKDIHMYTNGTHVVNVIHGRVFLQGEEMTEWTCQTFGVGESHERILLYDGTEVVRRWTRDGFTEYII